MAAVLRYVGGTKKSAAGTLYVQCHVKPNVSKLREGVAAVTDAAVEICVAAPPRDGESNKAVIDVLCRALGVPKSSAQITRGTKSRDKTIAVTGMVEADDQAQELLDRVKTLLTAAAEQ